MGKIGFGTVITMKIAKKRVVALLLCVASAALMAGCAFGYEADDNYPYDIAVEHGYTGTEGEWLTAQETPDTVYRRMYDEAVKDGSFTGTYFEFLQGLDLSADATPYIQRALLSVVSITARFPSTGETLLSSGAGVIYKLDKEAGEAYIVTNYHVLYSSSKQAISENISVYLYGNEGEDGAIPASYLGGAMDCDLAVLRVENDAFKTGDVRAADLGGSVIAGEPVYAIGNPLNKNISVTGGVVSVEEEWVTLKAANDTSLIVLPEIRIDASVNHGNSGGGLFNAVGELVGIVNARSSSEDVSGFGYAIPLELVTALAENAIENDGEVTRLHDGLKISVAGSRAVYDETTGRTHISQKLCVDDRSAGAGSYIGLRAGDTLISGYALRGGERVCETQFTHRCAWEAFCFRVRQGDTICLTVSREGTETTLQRAVSQSLYFDVFD